MTQPLISVIIGAYNVESEDVLQRTVGSVLRQSYGNFECVICDDGSQNETYSWLQRISKSDRRIVLLKNDQNIGLAATLNKCLAITKGELIARQDTDDMSEPQRFAEQVNFLNKNQHIAFVGCNCILYDENGIWGERCFPELPLKRDFLFGSPFVHGTLMFRKDCLQAVGGYRVAKETLRTEDYDLQMRLYAAGYYGSNIQEKLYHFLEDEAAMKRRKYRYRIDEAVVRQKGFTALGLMPGAIPYVIKPLIVGLIPMQLLNRMKDIYYSRRI